MPRNFVYYLILKEKNNQTNHAPVQIVLVSAIGLSFHIKGKDLLIKTLWKMKKNPHLRIRSRN